MKINGNIIGANNRPTSNNANGVWRWDASTMHRLYNQFPLYVAPVGATFQGTVSGYTSGGDDNNSYLNTIDKFPFATNANATDVGDLTASRYGLAGQSSDVSGYSVGGRNPQVSPGNYNIIDKFPFASNANATDVGDSTAARLIVTGQSSATNGYTSGPHTFGDANVIDKFPFASNANATDVGDLTAGRGDSAGNSSDVNGYTSGGNLGPNPVVNNIIDKFPFASDANATDVGDMTKYSGPLAGQSSTTSGYTSGGANLGGYGTFSVNIIDKFPFATNANATDVGDLTAARSSSAGQSSTASGYTSGGSPPGFGVNIIDKFPFASNANATDVGDLSQSRKYAAGQQD